MPNSDSSKKSNLLNQALVVVYSLIFILAVLNLVGTNALATQGVVLDGIVSQTNDLKKADQLLRVEINKVDNLSYIENAAEQQGFRRINKSLVLSTPDAVASALIPSDTLR